MECETCRFGKRYEELNEEEKRIFREKAVFIPKDEWDKYLLCVEDGMVYHLVKRDSGCPFWKRRD